ncbi:DUF1871 family protein [Paenibacillus sp. 2TAB19]|uniref:DUF1871 family protein n=1 Tax=Paenibacillus sp. 2TAB19 TaxID=3233003 RepID=UPI003F9A9F4A
MDTMIDDNIKTVVTEAINSWNPYGLLPHAPDDEFESEIKKVIESIGDATYINELGHRIQVIFEKSFGEPFKIENCIEVARQIWSKAKS